MTILEALQETIVGIKNWIENNFLKKTDVDSEMSATSTNPVQNKVINTAICNINTLIGDVSVAEQVDAAIKGITHVGEDVEGKEYTINSTTVMAGVNAEIFNDYFNNKAVGDYSHSEGANTNALGNSAHAEGAYTKAAGAYTHAEGYDTNARSNYSHTEGNGTVSTGRSQHVNGEYNVIDIDVGDSNRNVRGKYVNIVGNGSGYDSRSNAHTLDWDGNAWFAGDVYIGGDGQDDDSVEKLITQTAASNQISEAISGINHPVSSVNGKIGAVTLTAGDVGADVSGAATNALADAKSYTNEVINATTADDFGIYVQDTEPVDATDGDIWVDTATDPTVMELELPTVTESDNGKVLGVENGTWSVVESAGGTITSPVNSINGKTGDVQLTASDVGALPEDTEIPSIEGLATEAYVATQLDNKVNKVDGKSLSANDYTTEEKNKLAGIADGATRITSIADVGAGTSHEDYVFMGKSVFTMMHPAINLMVSGTNYVNYYVLLMELEIIEPWSAYQSDFLIQDAENAYSGHFHWKCRTGATSTVVSVNKVFTVASIDNSLDNRLFSTYVVNDNSVTFRLYLQIPSEYHIYRVLPINTSYSMDCVSFNTPLYGNVDYDRFYETYTGTASTNVGTRSKYDSSGQQIDIAYIKDLSVSGNAVTYTKGNGAAGIIVIQDNNKVSKSGDTMTGSLSINTDADGTTPEFVLCAPANNDGEQACGKIYKNANRNEDYGLHVRDYTYGGMDSDNSCALIVQNNATLASKLQLQTRIDGANANYKLYGEHNKPTSSDIGLGNVDNVKQYSTNNPPPYPVTSVNGNTGAVTLSTLPDVTTADNGKVLMVVDGAWAVVDINLTIDADGILTA